MGKLIKLTNLIGETLLVNTNAIINIKIAKDKKVIAKGAVSQVALSDTSVMFVKESIDDIFEKSIH